MILTCRVSIQNGTTFYCRCQKFHPIFLGESVQNWEYVSLVNSKPYWNCTIWRFTKKYRCPVGKSWNSWLRGVPILNDNVVVKSRKRLICVEGDSKRSEFESRQIESSMSRGRIVLRREAFEAIMGPFFDNRANIFCLVLARERFENIGIDPSVNPIKTKRVVKLQTSVIFRITRLMNNQIKNEKKWAREMGRTGGGGLATIPNLHVCKHFLIFWGGTCGKEWRSKVLPWYRLVGVAIHPVSRKWGEPRCPQGSVVATWYGDESVHLSLPRPTVCRRQ